MKHLALFSILLLALLLPATTFAHDFEVDGIYYNKNGTQATVTYKGPSYSLYSNEYTGSVTIPSTVTNNGVTYSVTVIGESAFRDCSRLINVTIPNSVTTIGRYAFYGCSGLTSVTIGNSVTYIGYSAFSGCSGLTSVTIPNSVTYIGSYAFQGCSALYTINFNAVSCGDFSSTTNNQPPFNNLNISVINIGNSVERIPAYFAYGLSKLTSVTIPNSVTTIGNYAFQGCSALDTINFNAVSCADFSSSSSSPFYNLNISTINIGNSVERIPADFACGLSTLTSVTIPNSVTSIGSFAFSGCSGLTNVTIGNSVTNIGSFAFYGCSGLTTVTIPNSVASIGRGAFAYCTGLTGIDIPNSVTYIGRDAFSETAWYNNQPDGLVYASLVAYRYKGTMPEGTDINVKEGTLGIAESAFSGCSTLTSVTIPKSVISIGDEAFKGCSALDTINFNSISCADFYSSSDHPFNNLSISTINIGNSVERIPAFFAYGLSKLTSVTIGNSVTSIGYSAFSGCSGLTSVTIPKSVTTFDSFAFQGCYALDTLNFNAVSCDGFYPSYYHPFYDLSISTINIGNSVERIPADFAYSLKKLTKLTIGSSVSTIGSYAFSGCSGLISVVIPNSVTSIGSGAFRDCSGLTSVIIGNSVTTIGNYAFQGCYALDTINFNAKSCADFSSSSIHPFYNLYISTINIGNSVERIPAYFAYGLSTLTSVTIPNSVTTIGNSAFYGCSGLTSLTIPNSVTSIGNKAFYDCYNLESVISLKPEAVSLPSSAYSDNTYSSATLTVPVGSYNNYKQTNYWSRFSKIKESISVYYIALDYHKLSIYVGDVVCLSATVFPANANQQVAWSTSNSDVVSVESDGTVTGLKAGSATITATSCDGSGKQASCQITVLAFKMQIDTLTHIRGEAAELVEIPITFRNRNAISAIQFDVSLPSCASFGYPVMRLNESRVTSSHTFSYNKLSNNSYRVLIASPTSQVLNGNDGPLVYLNVLLNKTVSTAGDYYINISNIIAAEPDETRHALENVNGVIRYYYIVGDADGDLSVDIADYNATASKILARSPSPFYSDAADVDENSSINVTDLVGITNISLGIKPITLRYAPRQGSDMNLLTCEPLVIAAGEESEISLDMDCSFDFAAFQMDVELPQGLTLTGASLGSDATKLQLATATLPDGNIRLLASSFSETEVQGLCPNLLTLKVKATEDLNTTGEFITISNITFAERNLTSHEIDDLVVECHTSSAISELDGKPRIYVEDGRIIVETPVNGHVTVSDISGHTREHPVHAGRNEITPWCSGVLMIKMNNHVLKINMK